MRRQFTLGHLNCVGIIGLLPNPLIPKQGHSFLLPHVSFSSFFFSASLLYFVFFCLSLSSSVLENNRKQNADTPHTVPTLLYSKNTHSCFWDRKSLKWSKWESGEGDRRCRCCQRCELTVCVWNDLTQRGLLSRRSRPQKLAEQLSARRSQLPGGGQLCVRAHRPLLRRAVPRRGADAWRWTPWQRSTLLGIKKTQSVPFTPPDHEGKTASVRASCSLNVSPIRRKKKPSELSPIMHDP